MTLASTSRKPDRRVSLEAPHRRDHEASVERAMSKGFAPRDLSGLLRWFRDALDSETPATIHKSEVWRDHGTHAEGGSKLGTPAWSEPFRRFIAGSASECDEDGYFQRPLRAAIARMSRQHALTAQHLFQLALVQGDNRRHAENRVWSYEEMDMYLHRALSVLWHEWSPDTLRAG